LKATSRNSATYNSRRLVYAFLRFTIHSLQTQARCNPSSFSHVFCSAALAARNPYRTYLLMHCLHARMVCLPALCRSMITVTNIFSQGMLPHLHAPNRCQSMTSARVRVAMGQCTTKPVLISWAQFLQLPVRQVEVRSLVHHVLRKLSNPGQNLCCLTRNTRWSLQRSSPALSTSLRIVFSW